MAKYFSGRRRVGDFTLMVEGGRGRIDCRVFEQWEDIDFGTTARCGAEVPCVVEKATGLSEKATHTLKHVIEGAIGLKDVASLKEQVEKTIGREVNWTLAEKRAKTFSCRAPKCGRCTLTIYQLCRFYEIDYSRKKRFTWSDDVWDKKWTRMITERTNNHDAYPDIEEYDEACKCSEGKDAAPYDGRLIFDFDHISMRVPYRVTNHGFEAQLMYKVMAFDIDDRAVLTRGLEHGFSATVPAALIPEPLLFLGGKSEPKLEAAIIREVDESVALQGFPIAAVAAGLTLLTHSLIRDK